MVFILEESKARKIFENYKNVAAFTLGHSKGISENNLEISYAQLPFLPDDDAINAVIAGDVKLKKLIKNAVKALHSPNAENQSICITMTQIINMISSDKRFASKKSGPNIIVFVLDDGDKDTARAKLLVRYITALFGEFGVTPVRENKVVKKLFRGKKKKIINRVADFIHDNKKVRVSGDGQALKNMLLIYFGIELKQSSLADLNSDKDQKRSIELTKDQKKSLIKTLIETYTNNNMRVANGLSKKQSKEICKTLKKKNRLAVEAYEQFAELAAVDMPTVKSGYKGKNKPKMKVKKFAEFMFKNRNVPLLLGIYAHTTAVMLGSQVGSSGYNKLMAAAFEKAGANPEFSKAFIAAAKAAKE